MNEKLDYKKQYSDIYLPKTKPMLIDIPEINYIMVEGKGNPNEEKGEYKNAMQILYSLSFTIKMSKMGEDKIKGYFEYVVPPLEGLWWGKEGKDFDPKKKDEFNWISMIRQPEFVNDNIFIWAIKKAKEKNPEIDYSKAIFKSFTEGLCAQIMHKGGYDNEPESIKKIEEFIEKEKLKNDIGNISEDGMIRRHHEIYLSDPRKAKPENLRTVLRIPVRK